MGIFGAITTAVTGLQAQSTALEHISNNIANSQTTGFKRTETSFVDLVPDSPAKAQALGVVNANSRATNSVQGDVSISDTETSIAINGDGYFIVGESIGVTDGNIVFNNEDLYTRRGDFELDRFGHLVNGGGYYLKGLPIDPDTGNPAGSSPEIITVSNDFLAAKETTLVDYRTNLASYPRTTASDEDVPGSELLNPADFANNPINGNNGFVQGVNSTLFVENSISGGAVTAFDAGGNSANIQLRWAKIDSTSFIDASQQGTAVAGLSGSADLLTDTALSATETLTLQLDSGTVSTFTFGTGTGEINSAADLITAIQGSGNYQAFIDDTNRLSISSTDGENLTIGGTGAGNLGLTSGTITASGGQDTWNLFYLEDSSATGTDPAWRNVGTDYIFGNDGQLNPQVTTVTLAAPTINGVPLGNIEISHGTNGITQFADANGTAQITDIGQNGYAAGELNGLAVSDEGRIVANYSNGQQLDIASVELAEFNAEGFLRKLDGGAYQATDESGEPILGGGGNIVGSALESSNTDIADEFTKLIITQQAYAANTRIVTTGDEMIQEALNMVR